jgi:hypothetical protein
MKRPVMPYNIGEVMDMDYSAFHEFPFPSRLTGEEDRAKRYFMTLPDEEQLQLLNGCQSYEEFRFRVFGHMNTL